MNARIVRLERYQDRHPSRVWWLAGGGVLSFLLLPLFLVPIPPLLDYPNHLARFYIEAHPEDVAVRRFYSPDWKIVPYAATDALAVLFQQVLSLRVTGKILLGLAVCLPVAGAAAWHRTSAGRVSLWAWGAAPFSYSTYFLMGFYNFYIACGLALLAAALWMGLRQKHPVLNIISSTFAAATIFLFHLYGALFYLVLIGSSEASIVLVARRTNSDLVSLGRTGLVRILPATVVLAILCLASHEHAPDAFTEYRPAGFKLAEATWPWAGYPMWETSVGFAVWLLLAWGMRSRAMTILSPCLIASGGCLLLFLVSPYALLGAEYFSSRFAQMASWAALAGLQPRKISCSARTVLAACLVLFTIYRVGVTSGAWVHEERDLIAVEQVISVVEPGAKVLYVTSTHEQLLRYRNHSGLGGVMGDAPAYIHFPAALVFERHAFWPLLLSVRGTMPVEVNAPYLGLSMPQGVAPSYRTLNPGMLTHEVLHAYPYLQDWRNNFDYVLLMPVAGVPDVQALLPRKLALVKNNGFAALYRVLATPPD